MLEVWDDPFADGLQRGPGDDVKAAKHPKGFALLASLPLLLFMVDTFGIHLYLRLGGIGYFLLFLLVVESFWWEGANEPLSQEHLQDSIQVLSHLHPAFGQGGHPMKG